LRKAKANNDTKCILQLSKDTQTDKLASVLYSRAALYCRFNKSGDYLRRWLPELEHVPSPAIHRPWTLSAADRIKCVRPARLCTPDTLLFALHAPATNRHPVGVWILLIVFELLRALELLAKREA
jgi:hypothetical protein